MWKLDLCIVPSNLLTFSVFGKDSLSCPFLNELPVLFGGLWFWITLLLFLELSNITNHSVHLHCSNWKHKHAMNTWQIRITCHIIPDFFFKWQMYSSYLELTAPAFSAFFMRILSLAVTLLSAVDACSCRMGPIAQWYAGAASPPSCTPKKPVLAYWGHAVPRFTHSAALSLGYPNISFCKKMRCATHLEIAISFTNKRRNECAQGTIFLAYQLLHRALLNNVR